MAVGILSTSMAASAYVARTPAFCLPRCAVARRPLITCSKKGISGAGSAVYSGLVLCGFSPLRISFNRQAATRFRVKTTVALINEAASKTAGGETENAFHTLPSGLQLAYTKCTPLNVDQSLPPLLFIHGSFHASWCFVDKFFPYFSNLGHEMYSISLLGQGESSIKEGSKVAGTMDEHSVAVLHFIASLPAPPVIICHSFAGLIVQKCLTAAPHPFTNERARWMMRGIAFLCSVPPTGNANMILRFLRRHPITGLKVSWSIAAKGFATSLDLCRIAFFSEDLPEADLKRYQQLCRESAKQALLDVREVQKTVPLPPPPPASERPPILVLGAENDNLVDKEGVDELAAAYGVQPVVMAGMAHDVMLDTKWTMAADAIIKWLKESGLSRTA